MATPFDRPTCIHVRRRASVYTLQCRVMILMRRCLLTQMSSTDHGVTWTNQTVIKLADPTANQTEPWGGGNRTFVGARPLMQLQLQLQRGHLPPTCPSFSYVKTCEPIPKENLTSLRYAYAVHVFHAKLFFYFSPIFHFLCSRFRVFLFNLLIKNQKLRNDRAAVWQAGLH